MNKQIRNIRIEQKKTAEKLKMIATGECGIAVFC